MKQILCLLALFLGVTLNAYAADITLQWDPQTDATGFKIYRSLDLGATWAMHKDIPNNVNEILLKGEPDTGIILYRASAYNVQGESIRFNAGTFYWGDAPRPPGMPNRTAVR